MSQVEPWRIYEKSSTLGHLFCVRSDKRSGPVRETFQILKDPSSIRDTMKTGGNFMLTLQTSICEGCWVFYAYTIVSGSPGESLVMILCSADEQQNKQTAHAFSFVSVGFQKGYGT